MTLDVPTLMLAGAFVALLSASLLVFAWYQYREMSPVLWWAAGDAINSIGIALLAVGSVLASEPVKAFGFAALATGPGLIWVSSRGFCRLPARRMLAFVGGFSVLAAHAITLDAPIEALEGVLSTLFGASYLAAAAWTLAMRSPERLRARWPLAGFALVHGATLLLGAVAAPRSDNVAVPELFSLFGIIHFEAILFFIGSTIFVVASMREESELRHQRAATVDSLTGLPNRGSFFEQGERIAGRCGIDGTPFAVVALDLDHFKTINDTFGHATGDRALQVFGEIVRKSLRPSDMLGRIGGEEFAAILPGSGIEAAFAMAERIRRAFAEAGGTIDGRRANATVSAGCAAFSPSETVAPSLAVLLQRADGALYRAKSNGRNRVECEGDARPTKTSPRLVRIA